MKKAIFIIPGFKHQPGQKAYRELTKILRRDGYTPVPVKIRWRATTISENAAAFVKKYRQTQAREKYILGFSFGAMIAFLAATKVKPRGLILCSLSPYFQEDLCKRHHRETSRLAKYRYDDFASLNSQSLAKQVKAKRVLFLYGEKEAKPLIWRVIEAYKQIVATEKYVMQIQNAEHNIADRRYLRSIQYATKRYIA